MTRKFRVTIGGITYNVEVEEIGGHGNAPAPVQSAANVASVSAVSTAPVAPGAAVRATVAAPAPAVVKTPEPSSAGDVVRAPLPGLVVGVKVEPGQQVNSGDVLLVLEAMKMENDIVATASGTVKEIMVSKGTTVGLGDALVVIG